MTDVLDRVLAPQPDQLPTAVAHPRRFVPNAGIIRVAAALSIAAGVIHLVMVPSHSGESLAEGIAFALSGWFQILTAWLLLIRLTRLTRKLLAAIAAANLTFVGAWVVSRTVGIPFGAHAGHAETVGFVDVTTVAFEVALLLACALLALRFGQRVTAHPRVTHRFANLLVVGVAVMATVAIASPSARDHSAHSHGDDASTAASSSATHDHTATPVDDKGLAALSNGHHHVIGPEEPLDATTRAQLSHQIAITQQVAAQYPTVADAEAAGYRRAGPYSPGLGAHYIKPSAEGLNFDGTMDDTDLAHPLAIIYAGTDPGSPVAGFMYYSMSTAEPPGFAGPNDHWHYHTNTCLKYTATGEIDAPFGADSDVPADLCTAAGGQVLEQTQWMVHVWSVPGWESQQGLFGEVNPALTCPDGTYYQLPLDQWIDHPLNVCRT